MNLLSPTSSGARAFRPMFLLAGAFASIVVPAWMLVLTGRLHLSGVLQGTLWHGHEMVFGFTVAVLAGFLLTATENWTGRRTLRGVGALAFAGLWTAARLALLAPGWIGPILDLAVLPVLAIAIAWPIVATRSFRNLPFVLLLGMLWAADVAVFVGGPGVASHALGFAVYVIVAIIVLVTTRIVPMFTRNATGETPGTSRVLDVVAAAGAGAVAVLEWWPEPLRRVAAGVAGTAILLRAVLWWTPGVRVRPLLWVLHLGHAAVGSGLWLVAAGDRLGLVGSAGLHVLTVGGIGLLTIGMMARVSLGHTGRPIRVGAPMGVAFGITAIAAVVRALGPTLEPALLTTFWWVSALAWAGAFVAFTLRFAPVLLSPRADGAPG